MFLNNHANQQALIEALQITTLSGEIFVIANHFGIGINKLIKGGWPNQTHFSLPNETFKECSWKEFPPRKFDYDQYSQHESQRRVWQKANYPNEFEKLERLRKVALNFKP